MCGRMTLEFDIDTIKAILKDEFHVKASKIDEFKPSYNLAPTNQVVALIETQGERRSGLLQWGLIPNWRKEDRSSQSLINARCETIAQKPSFSDAYNHRRCIILASGFYEWHRQGKTKQAYRFVEKNKPLMAMAGIWQRHGSNENVYTCAVVTTEANALMGTIHDRMPVILDEDGINLWFDPLKGHEARRKLFDMSQYPLRMYPVSSIVNSIKNDGPVCIEAQE